MEPEGGQDTQLQELNEKMITESDKEAILQQFHEKREGGQFAEDDDDDVEQKSQWSLDMLPGTHGAASKDCTSAAVGN